MKTALLALALTGCYHTVGQVVTDVRPGGGYTKCDLVVSQSILLPGSDSLQNCIDETGKPSKVKDAPK